MSGPHDFLPEPLAPLYSDAEINGFFLDVRVRGGQTKNYRDRAGSGVWGGVEGEGRIFSRSGMF